MPTITVRGQTTRSFYRNISNEIYDGNIPFMTPYSTITNKDYKTERHNICFNILWAISGGEPMNLISNAFPDTFLMQMEPLNSVCTHT